MTKSDITRTENGRRTPKITRQQRDYDEFRETLATPMPSQTYRSDLDIDATTTSSVEQAIRIAATLLGALVALRFLANLFTTDTGNTLVNFVRTVTDWLVQPFDIVFGRIPLGNGAIDLSAVAAMVVVAAIAAILIRLMRPPVE